MNEMTAWVVIEISTHKPQLVSNSGVWDARTPQEVTIFDNMVDARRPLVRFGVQDVYVPVRVTISISQGA